MKLAVPLALDKLPVCYWSVGKVDGREPGIFYNRFCWRRDDFTPKLT